MLIAQEAIMSRDIMLTEISLFFLLHSYYSNLSDLVRLPETSVILKSSAQSAAAKLQRIKDCVKFA